MKRCKVCGLDRPFSDFYKNANCRDGHLSQCKGCTVRRYEAGRAERARRDRRYFQQIKLDRGCVDCGYNAHPAALEFDHMPGTVKRYAICAMAGMRRDLIDAEIAKCEVVCANCHRIRSMERKQMEHGRPRKYPIAATGITDEASVRTDNDWLLLADRSLFDSPPGTLP